MVEERITDGRRIAELLSSEVDGRTDDELEHLSVTNADRNVEPAVNGARAFDIALKDERLARVFVQPDRLYLAFDRDHETVVDAAETVGLRVRPKATSPPKTLVFVETGAHVKRAVAVLQTACRPVNV